jgi:hypothetical protein
MGSREVLKSLRDFAKRELMEKKAESVVVRRVKLRQLMRRGRIPDFRLRGVEGAHYLVCVFGKDSLRVYFVDGDGVMSGAEEFGGEERQRILAEISERSKIVFRFP